MNGSHRINRSLVLASVVLAAALSGGCALFRPHIEDLTFVSIRPAPHPPGRAAPLVLRFTTSRDLQSLSEHGPPYVKVTLCPYSRDKPEVSFTTLDDPAERRDAVSQPSLFEYSVAFAYQEQRQFNPTTNGFDSYALPSEPQDLCFVAAAGSYFGLGGFDTNVAVIPKDALARALSDLRSQR